MLERTPTLPSHALLPLTTASSSTLASTDHVNEPTSPSSALQTLIDNNNYYYNVNNNNQTLSPSTTTTSGSSATIASSANIVHNAVGLLLAIIALLVMSFLPLFTGEPMTSPTALITNPHRPPTSTNQQRQLLMLHPAHIWQMQPEAHTTKTVQPSQTQV